MIVRCPDCLTKYEIAAGRVPDEGIRVRCPKCKAVFPVSRTSAEEREPLSFRAPEPPPVPAPESVRAPVAAAAPSPGGSPDGAAIATAAAEGEAPMPRASRRITDPQVARRLARAILQEMLLARRQEHRAALAEGSVLSRFGPSVLACRGLYDEKLSPDLPEGDAIFLDAVRDVVGEGTPLF